LFVMPVSVTLDPESIVKPVGALVQVNDADIVAA